MQNLKVPTIKPKDVLDNIIKYKRKPRKGILSEMKSDLLSRFEEYEKNKNALENINYSIVTTNDEKEALLSCYKRTGYLEKNVIKASIKDIQTEHLRVKCPYCRVDTAATMDHYLPKEKFPEFSFLPINLVPCCSRCNSIKGERWIFNDNRIFINYYFDNLDIENFLKSKIKYKKDAIKTSTNIKYSLETGDIQDKDLSKTIESHFFELELLDRYNELVGEELSNIYTSVMKSDYSLDEHIRAIRNEFNVKKEIYGDNHWKVVLYYSILESDYIEDLYKLKSE